MRNIAFAAAAIVMAFMAPVAATAQSIQIGPGGVRVYEDRPRVYQERRVYEERPRYYEERRGRGLCRELRRACEDGPRGEGNCRRFRETCG